jgi:hypothetical protein
MTETKKSLSAGLIATALLSGCATHGDILGAGVRGKFQSTQSPMALAQCIDRNADSFALGSLRSKIVNTGKEPLEVVILNGATHWAIVHVSAIGEGSTADFYLGGVALMTPQSAINGVTKDCK